MSAPFSPLHGASGRITVAAADGATLPLYAMAGPEHAPGLLVGHANGLAAGSYEPWLRELAGSFRVFAFDARGHGGATWPAGPFTDVFAVDRFADDLARVAAAVRARLGNAPLHFAGHSLSAAAAVRLALDGAKLPFDVATLFEPPIFPPLGSPNYAEADTQQEKLVRGSLRRERRWASPAALEAYLRDRGVFQTFEPAMLKAHCEACLRLEGVHYVLRCPPEIESAIFANHRPADTWSRLATVRAPLHLVSGDPAAADRDWVTGAMASIADGLHAASLEALQGAGHMMIFQQSQRCAELLRRHARR
jgi:pimeloyl-ACP methyl ester carboxylesterase